MKRVILMIEGMADQLILPIAAFIILSLFSVIGFGIKKMLIGIYTKLDSVSNDLYEMKMESALLRGEIQDIYKTTDLRFQGVEAKLSRVEDKAQSLREDLNNMKEDIRTVKRHHYKHHPDDNIHIK